METHSFFVIAFSLLLTHEMDAVRRHEWKVFPFLARIQDDERGYMLFTAIHIPLYTFLLGSMFSNGTTLNQTFVYSLDVFCLLHVLLHLLFIRHPHYQFNNWFSWCLILGAGIAGSIDLLMRTPNTLPV